MKYYRIDEIDNVEKPKKYGYETIIVMDEINKIAFFKLVEREEHKEIEALKKKLAETDYLTLKYTEGQLTEEEFAPIREQRQAWREKINELETKLEV